MIRVMRMMENLIKNRIIAFKSQAYYSFSVPLILSNLNINVSDLEASSDVTKLAYVVFV